MKASHTHFEQIPVETVKKIAQELPAVAEIDDVRTETKDEVAIEPKRWREVAQRVQVENDPQKMMKLVEDLIAAFDEEEFRKSGKTSATETRDTGPSPISSLGVMNSATAPD